MYRLKFKTTNMISQKLKLIIKIVLLLQVILTHLIYLEMKKQQLKRKNEKKILFILINKLIKKITKIFISFNKK